MRKRNPFLASQTHKKVKRIRQITRHLRWILPILSGFFLLLLIGWPQIKYIVSVKLKPKAAMLMHTHDMSHHGILLNPVFQAQTQKGEIFSVRAEKATVMSSQEAYLDVLTGDVQLDNGRLVSLQAGKGIYHPKEQSLTLLKECLLTDQEGNVFHCHSSELFVKEGRIVSNEHVHGYGPMGTLEADAFEMQQNGDIIILKGQAKVVLIFQEGLKKR